MTFENELLQLPCAFFSDEWLDLTEQLWGYHAERVCYQLPGHELPKLEGVFYLTKGGKIVQPPTYPFLPFRFTLTATQKECQLYSQKLELLKQLAADIKKRGWKGTLAFPPGFVDGRAFQWEGIEIEFGYTFVGQLPYDPAALGTNVRGKIRKAANMGYTTARSTDWKAIVGCLRKTQDVKGFDYYLNENRLRLLAETLGPDVLLAHLAYAPDGTPVSAQLKLACKDGICIDWMAGTDRAYIKDGVNQYLYAAAMQEVTDTGTHYFNYCGANIEPVARAKSEWGFPLVPYLEIKEKSVMRFFRRILRKNAWIKALYYRAKKCMMPQGK